MGTIQIHTPVPGPASRALAERRARVVAPGVATAHPIFLAHAKGATVTDVDGNVIRFLMPLMISEGELEEGLAVVEAVIG